MKRRAAPGFVLAFVGALPAIACADGGADARSMRLEGCERAATTGYASTYETCMARFESLFEQGGPSGAVTAAAMLAEHLRAEPSAADRLKSDTLSGALAPGMRAAAFLALELSSTPEARSVLEAILRDPRFDDVDRERAALALADIGRPDAAVARTLHRASREDPADSVARMSLLAMGMLSHRSEGSYPAVRDVVQVLLERELDRTHDRKREAAILQAIGASGDEFFSHAVAVRLHNGDPMLRVQAADTFGRMDAAVAMPHLVEQLEIERDVDVSVAIVESLLVLGAPSERAIPVAQLRLQHATSKALKIRLLTWLGRASESPNVEAILRAQLARESDFELKALIERVMPAELL